jgi:two-component system cell cycle sensor histidine kinase/response regulator CckA
MLTVTATRKGIAEDAKEPLFDPLTSEKLDEGGGLGVSSAYGIVRRSGGYIMADSAPGRGTAFRIYLPQVSGTESTLERDHPGDAVSLT